MRNQTGVQTRGNKLGQTYHPGSVRWTQPKSQATPATRLCDHERDLLQAVRFLISVARNAHGATRTLTTQTTTNPCGGRQASPTRVKLFVRAEPTGLRNGDA